MTSESWQFTSTFASDGVYHCDVWFVTPLGNYSESLEFIAQFPIPDITFVQGNITDLPDLVTVNNTLLRGPNFNESLTFLVLRQPSTPLPTNCSWTVDFDNGITKSSTEYIAVGDGSLTLSNYDHVISVPGDYIHGGEFNVTIYLWNDISSVKRSFEHTIYEQITNLSMTDIDHIVSWFRFSLAILM